MLKWLLAGVVIGGLIVYGVISININWDKANQLKSSVQTEVQKLK